MIHMAYGELVPRINARPGQPRLKFEGVEHEIAEESVRALREPIRRRILDARLRRQAAAARS